MSRWRLLRGIRDKLIVSFTLLVATIAAFVFVFFPARLERQALRATISKAEVVRDMTAYSLRAALVFGDTAALAEVLSGAGRVAGIHALVVRDTADRTVARWSDTRAMPGARLARPLTGKASSVHTTETAIVHDGARIGRLIVAVPLTDLRRDVASARRLGGLISLVIFGVGLALVYAISTLVTRPLTAVSQTVNRIAEGDLSLRAEETNDQEVTGLVRAFNRMVDSVAGAQAQLFSLNRDLEVRVAERTAEARANSETLQSLIDLAPQAIISVDLEWRVTRWNKAAERLFGWTAEEVIGGPVPYIPPDRAREFANRQHVVREGGNVASSEATRLRKDGSRIDVLVAAAPLRDRDDTIVGYIAVVTDVTERKHLEAQLRQSQKMEAIGRLAGGVAHDFNNILTVITGCASILLARPRTPDDREDIEQISTAALRAAALTRQLLTFSRKQVVQLESVNLNNIVHNMGPMLRRLLRENIDLNTHLGAALGTVTADASQIEQVIMNLVVNASDAMPSGGSLAISTQNVVLSEAQLRDHPDSRSGPYVQLIVKDSGTGMDEATLARIFEPFFTTKEVGRGTGLGLATTYAIVTQAGGHIAVNSRVGVGTTFEVYFPRTMSNVTRTGEHAVISPSEPGLEGSETVLLVEDEATVRRMLLRTLQRFGYNVLEAADGESAIAVSSKYQGRIDAVVTDLMMPGINGRVVADALLKARPGLRVVFMSGYADETVDTGGMVDATHSFLGKPFTATALATTLRDLLDGRTAALV